MNTKIIFATLCLIASGTAFSASSVEDNTSLPVDLGGSTLTRAEVKADLKAWRQAGMPQYTSNETGVDLNGPEYRQAYARYLSLREAPLVAERTSKH